MNKELKQIKRLAEQHFYRGRKLTNKERFMVENSPFAGVLLKDKSDTNFYKILEQYGLENNINLTDTKPATRNVTTEYKRGYLNMGVNRAYLRDLIDDIEDAFELGVYSNSLYKYSNVDAKNLKDYIKNHVSRNYVASEYPGTASQINEIVSSDGDASDIMYKIYSLQR